MTALDILAQLFAPDPPRWTDYHGPLEETPAWKLVRTALLALSSAVMIAAISYAWGWM